MRILLIAGGWSGERDVSLKGALEITQGLETLGHQVTLFDPVQDLRGLEQALKDQDFVFLNLHGAPGEDGLIQALLESQGLPFQGAHSRGSLLALNKAVAKQIFQKAGLTTPAWEFVPASQVPTWSPTLSFPLVVKPNTGGSSLGVGLINSEQDLKAYLSQSSIAGQDLVVEERILGREMTCGVVEGMLLPPVLIEPHEGEFFDYASKYVPGASAELCPAPISSELTRTLQAMAQKAHESLGLVDYSRADFMVDTQDQAYLLEVNTLPGMTSTSLLPLEARVAGLSFPQLLARLIDLGLRKTHS